MSADGGMRMKSKLLSKTILVLIAFSCLAQLQAQPSSLNSKLSFDNDVEYIDFCYALEPVLRRIYPKISMGWVRQNTSPYESDLRNIILLADRDFNHQKKVSFVTMAADNLKANVNSVISQGVPIFARRKFAKEKEAIWVVVIGFLDNGNRLIVNDSKLGPALEISSSDIDSAYYFFIDSGKPDKTI